MTIAEEAFLLPHGDCREASKKPLRIRIQASVVQVRPEDALKWNPLLWKLFCSCKSPKTEGKSRWAATHPTHCLAPPLPQLTPVCRHRTEPKSSWNKDAEKWIQAPACWWSPTSAQCPARGRLRFTTQVFQLQCPSPTDWTFDPFYPTAKLRHGHFFELE